jgi:hypothetical protein
MVEILERKMSGDSERVILKILEDVMMVVVCSRSSFDGHFPKDSDLGLLSEQSVS